MIEKIWNDPEYLRARIAMCEAEASLLRERLAEIVGEASEDTAETPFSGGLIKEFCAEEFGCEGCSGATPFSVGDEDDGYID